jgi:4-aminobutyrate aminotransferase-like enzyme
MALAQIREIERRDLVQRSATRGQELLAQLRAGVARRRGRLRFTVRGQGLMVGLDVLREGGQGATSEVWHLVLRMLQRGFLVLPEGEYGQVLALTPPLIIGPGELGAAAEALGQSVNEL